MPWATPTFCILCSCHGVLTNPERRAKVSYHVLRWTLNGFSRAWSRMMESCLLRLLDIHHYRHQQHSSFILGFQAFRSQVVGCVDCLSVWYMMTLCIFLASFLCKCLFWISPLWVLLRQLMSAALYPVSPYRILIAVDIWLISVIRKQHNLL